MAVTEEAKGGAVLVAVGKVEVAWEAEGLGTETLEVGKG